MKKLFIGLVILAPVAFGSIGCKGTLQSFSTGIGGTAVTEKTTENLLCGVAEFGDRISVSCVKK